MFGLWLVCMHMCALQVQHNHMRTVLLQLQAEIRAAQRLCHTPVKKRSILPVPNTHLNIMKNCMETFHFVCLHLSYINKGFKVGRSDRECSASLKKGDRKSSSTAFERIRLNLATLSKR